MTEVVSLFAELNNLKRVGVAGSGVSLAERFFTRGWAALVSGQDVCEVALRVSGQFIASARLGGIDRCVLASAGLDSNEITGMLARSFREVSAGLDAGLSGRLEGQLAFGLEEGRAPEFVNCLCSQPRAGATSPGKPRILLLPAESHGDHCLVVGVYAVCLAPRYGASIGKTFLAALAHHLHNAYLPDAGFTGEEMLGSALVRVMATFRKRAGDQLDQRLREQVLEALEAIATADTAEGKAFHAADVMDRVLQMKWYESAANFQLHMAMEDMELVHAGPVQEFHRTVLRESGLW